MPTALLELKAILTDIENNPLAGKTVSFYYKPSTQTTWIFIESKSTDSSGTAVTTVTVTAPGTYDFKAEFAGDNQYDPSSAETTNYTVKVATKLTLTVTRR